MQITYKKPFKIILDYESEYYDLKAENFGLCLACGEDSYGREPDTEGYRCDSCGKNAVSGLMHLLSDNRIVFDKSFIKE